MVLNISNRNLTVIENGIYYFELSDYPRIKDYEMHNIITFINYERLHGRKTDIICDDENIIEAVNNATAHPDKYTLPHPKDAFIYHGTNIDAAQKILSCNRLLSATRVYGKTGEALAHERRNSLWNDPADYFEYIMFCWGDNPTGDYVVLSDNFPNAEDLEQGNFNPGVRFYFRLGDIMQHHGHIFDGYHAVKVKNEIILADYLHSCIVPEQYKHELINRIPEELTTRVHYLSQESLGISDWNDKVYNLVCTL